ncbi:class I SAM-dependent methyltransferase [Haloarchaeobius amylolyticus]|uniref:class I SAM-dependent methyltransferase n=1 Tax=Haloarchaeobius amylolyticus TaxID=1198296 RepID=UPI00226EB732|nr:class I SAM-dependent methyltransferase [Haloarchaeobius amylolyticus]
MDDHDPDTTADETHASYDQHAERADEDHDDLWRTPWGDNPLQEHYAWPATTDLLPDVEGARVLDAGCGVGDHVEWFTDRGATVVGVDVSEEAVAVARERQGDRATFRQADLTEPLEFADDGVFDVVVSNLVLDHIADLEPVFAEFERVLADDGTLVVTMIHPMQFYLDAAEVTSYYDRTPVELGWEAGTVTSYHRPLGDIVTALTGADLHLDVLAEPEPDPGYAEHAAESWAVLDRPQICCLRAVPVR